MSKPDQDDGDGMQITAGSQRDDDDTNESSPTSGDEEESMMVTTSPEGKHRCSDGIPSAAFLPDERVYAKEKDGGMYEAIIRKASFDGCWTYFVHYQGWNSRWDKWLKEGELLPDSEETRRHAGVWQNEQRLQQQEQQRNVKKEKRKPSSDRKRKKGSVTTSDEVGSGNGQRNKRRSNADAEGDLLTLFEDACELPFTLKSILVEDHERSIRKGFDSLNNGYDQDMKVGKKWRPARDVHHLPAAITIQTVLNHYVKIKRKEATDEKSSVVEDKARSFVDGLASLFDKALPVFLLYPTERAQHLAVEADSKLKNLRKVNLYGCEHLLRLFVRLPQLLAHAPPSDVKATAKQLSDLIVLLQKNRQSCFKAKYREPRQEELNDWEKALRDGTNTTVHNHACN